mgnify:CR=1 FL=1
MIRRTAIIATSAVLVVLGSAAVIQATAQNRAQSIDPFTEKMFAQDAPQRRGMGWLQDLNLSQDQMRRIQAIRQRDRSDLSRDREAVRQRQQELRSLMAGTASEDEIRRKYQEVRDIRIRLVDAQFDSMLEMRNVLNPEQRQKFAERMDRNRQNFRERMRDRSPGQS